MERARGKVAGVNSGLQLSEFSLSPDQLREIHRRMWLSRRLDDQEMALRKANQAFFHIPGAGHEVIQAAAGLVLRPGYDWFYAYYRDRTLMLALGMTPEEMLMAAVGSHEDPGSGGRQIPSNWGHVGLNVVSRSSCTGTQFLQAAGSAAASLLITARQLPLAAQPDDIVYCSAGDGTAAQGEFWHALSRISTERLPVLILIEDNGLAISVPTSVQYSGGDISRLVTGFPNLLVLSVDGGDFTASLEAMTRAARHVRDRAGPALVRAVVTRPYGHSISDDQARYRTSAELEEERQQDGLTRFTAELMRTGVLKNALFEELRQDVDQVVAAAARAALESRRPPAGSACDHLYGPLVTISGKEDPSGPPLPVPQLLNQVLEDEQRFTPELVRLSADRHSLGEAVGMAIRGLRPVLDLSEISELWAAMMHLKNELPTLRYRSAGTFACPLVLCVPQALGQGEALLTHVPGLRILYPARAREACGLLRAALRASDPVLFFTPTAGVRAAPYPGAAFTVPFGRARCAHAGDGATVVAWGSAVGAAVRAAEGTPVEVLDLQTLAPWDQELVAASVARTGRLLVLEPDLTTSGFGAEVAAWVGEQCFTRLKAPVRRRGQVGPNDDLAPDLRELLA